ncbi:MAG TPA: CehA/McbA family metallohydrolase, partial [Candidatus Limnocylindria bacterium]|nr:CehA/McbA family metallohydrolase [Candidatus Limnocylindria bacterium]
MQARILAALVLLLAAAPGAEAGGGGPDARQIGAGDTALLFGGADAEGGIGDWYVTNGVVEAIIDDAGPVADLAGIVPPEDVPPRQASAAPTGGNLLDLGLVGADNDQLSQMFTVGGLSTSNFVLYDAVTAPAPGVVRASGALLLPPDSTPENPCITLVTDYRAEGSDPFLTIVTTATNGCAGTVNGLTGFLDAFVWTQRANIPFSAGVAPSGGRGFDHAVLDLANPAPSLEVPTFMAAPGTLMPRDGVIDPATGTASGEVCYGLLPVEIAVDLDGAGSEPPIVTPVNSLFGVSSTLASALGNPLMAVPLPPGGSYSYTRRFYVGGRNDVRSVSDPIVTALADRTGFATGTISGDVDAADTLDVEAGLLVRRLGRCGGSGNGCASSAECGGAACEDPVPTAGFGPGGYVTHVRTDADGTFDGVVLPQGDYEVRISAAERDDVVISPVTVGPGDTALAVPDLTARGLLRFTVREKRKGKPALPAKLVIHGTGGTPDPRLGRRFTARLGGEDVRAETFGGTERGPEGGARGQGNVVYTTTGSGAVALRPGTYEVWASRGPEYGIARESVTVTAGAAAEVSFLLKRVLKARDALSADFHVHSVRSFDSSTPLEDRVASFAAEGVEVIVSTDHDKHLDYAPVVADLDLVPFVRAIPGVEVTGSVPNPPAFPNSFGHINAWPMPVVSDAPRDGAIDDEYVAPNWLYSRLRARGGPDTVIQYNHPRAGVAGLTTIGFFNSIGCQRCANAIDTPCVVDEDCPAGPERECTCVGYQPDRPLDEPPNDVLLDSGVLGPGSPANPDGVRNIDFDVLEIANGARAGDFPALLQMRADWFSLLAQDVRKFGTAVSDSHRATLEHAGWGRTFVLGAGDDPAALDVAAFNARVRAGAMVLSTGPYVELTARAGKARAGVGEELAAASGKVRLAIRVTSPAWIPVDEVRVLVNGAVVERFDATTKPRVRPLPANPESSGKTLRFKATRKLALDADAFVLVEAGVPLPAEGAPGPTTPEPMNQVVDGVVPYAVTNPIFVDVGADGYTAPGLPAAALARAGRMTG